MASIIALNPKILVVDEPTTGLDAKGAAQVMSLIQKCHDQGTSILLISHDLDLVTRHAHRLAVMDQGKLVLEAPLTRALEQREVLVQAGILPQERTAP